MYLDGTLIVRENVTFTADPYIRDVIIGQDEFKVGARILCMLFKSHNCSFSCHSKVRSDKISSEKFKHTEYKGAQVAPLRCIIQYMSTMSFSKTVSIPLVAVFLEWSTKPSECVVEYPHP